MFYLLSRYLDSCDGKSDFIGASEGILQMFVSRFAVKSCCHMTRELWKVKKLKLY